MWLPCQAQPERWLPDQLRRGRLPSGVTHGYDQEAIDDCKTLCPIRDRCLAIALEAEKGLPVHMRHGIFGGLIPRERLALDPPQEAKTCPAA